MGQSAGRRNKAASSAFGFPFATNGEIQRHQPFSNRPSRIALPSVICWPVADTRGRDALANYDPPPIAACRAFRLVVIKLALEGVGLGHHSPTMLGDIALRER